MAPLRVNVEIKGETKSSIRVADRSSDVATNVETRDHQIHTAITRDEVTVNIDDQLDDHSGDQSDYYWEIHCERRHFEKKHIIPIVWGTVILVASVVVIAFPFDADIEWVAKVFYKCANITDGSVRTYAIAGEICESYRTTCLGMMYSGTFTIIFPHAFYIWYWLVPGNIREDTHQFTTYRFIIFLTLYFLEIIVSGAVGYEIVRHMEGYRTIPNHHYALVFIGCNFTFWIPIIGMLDIISNDCYMIGRLIKESKN